MLEECYLRRRGRSPNSSWNARSVQLVKKGRSQRTRPQWNDRRMLTGRPSDIVMKISSRQAKRFFPQPTRAVFIDRCFKWAVDEWRGLKQNCPDITALLLDCNDRLCRSSVCCTCILVWCRDDPKWIICPSIPRCSGRPDANIRGSWSAYTCSLF